MSSLWVECYKGQQVLHFDSILVHSLSFIFAHSFQSICRILIMHESCFTLNALDLLLMPVCLVLRFEWGLTYGATLILEFTALECVLQLTNSTAGLQSCGCATFRRSQKGRVQRRGRLEWGHDSSGLMVQQDKWHFVRNKYSARNRYVVRYASHCQELVIHAMTADEQRLK